jgi:hypothetical protein
MLETFMVVTATQEAKGKKSPIQRLKADHMETYKSKEHLLSAIMEISTLDVFKDVVVKSIFSVNEYGAVRFYEPAFNGKLYLKECANPYFISDEYAAKSKRKPKADFDLDDFMADDLGFDTEEEDGIMEEEDDDL